MISCTGGCTQKYRTHALQRGRAYKRTHFQIYDVCSISPYEYVCVWRAFQHWAFSISNLLHTRMPNRFLLPVIWLLKTPERQDEKWETECTQTPSLHTEGGGIEMLCRFVKSAINTSFLEGRSNYDKNHFKGLWLFNVVCVSACVCVHVRACAWVCVHCWTSTTSIFGWTKLSLQFKHLWLELGSTWSHLLFAWLSACCQQGNNCSKWGP